LRRLWGRLARAAPHRVLRHARRVALTVTRAPLAVVGPTASGKSALAMAFARAHPEVELISVDSMQVYRRMDIGTAKPSPDDRAEVPHHCIDLVDPSDEFTLAEFQAAVRTAIAD